jgi:diguanylate cyclase (GGDEF)-like protein/PAS domain S-box-containing protein
MTSVTPIPPGPIELDKPGKSHSLAGGWPRLWLALALVLVSGVLLAWSLKAQRDQALESGQRLTASYARVIEEQTTRTIQTVDQRLQLAARGLSDLQATGTLNEDSARRVLREHRKSMPFVRAMWVMDAQGRILYDADEGNIGVSLQDRPYFQIYLSQPATGFHLGAPLRSGSTGTWLLAASRPLYKPDGSLNGIIVAAVEPPYFNEIWGTMDVGQGGSIALATRAGVLMTRAPHVDQVMGKDLGERPVFKEMVPRSPSGDYVDASGVDGVERLFAYRTLKQYPDFVVVVGQSSNFALAPWRNLATVAALIWLAASLTIIALSILLDRAGRQRKQAQRLTEQTAQRLALATEAAAIGIWDWDLARDQWSATPTYFTLLGDVIVSRYADLGAWLERVHPDDRTHVDTTFKAVIAGEVNEFHYEARFRHANGHYRWMDVTGRALHHDTGGKATRLLGARTDITERKEAQEARRQVLERVTDAFVAMDRDWVYTFVNEKAAAMLGKNIQGLVGKKMWDVCPELIGLPLHQACMKAMADQQPVHVEAFYAPDHRWFENHVYPSLEGVTLYFQDISPRKRAEQALQDSESRYRQLFDSNPQPMWVYDLATLDFLVVNDAAIAHYGYSREEFLGMTIKDIRPSEDIERLMDDVTTDKGNRSPASLWRHRRKDDSLIQVDITAHSLVYEDRPARLVLAHDVTAREQALTALRLSEENLSITLQSIGDAVIATDSLGNITRMNPMAERLTAWPLADALGQPLTEVFRIINAKTRAPAVDPVQLVLRSGKVVGLANHTALLARDGQEYQIFDSAAPMRDTHGAVIGVVLVFSDVTEAYRVNEALATTTRLLERTSELAKVGGWELDLRTQKIKLSKEILRLNRSQVEGEPAFEEGLKAYSEDVRRLITNAVQTTIATGIAFDLKVPREVKGRTHWIRLQGSPVSEDGQVIKIQGASQDITTQKLAELALQDSEMRFRNLVEWMPEAIVVHRNGTTLYANPAAAALFGATSAQQLVGTAALDRVHPEDRDRVIQRIQSLTQLGGSAPLADTRFLQLDGTVIDVQIQGTQIMYDGAPAVQAVMRDVSARRQSERLAAATQQALNKSAQHTQTILNNLMDGVITISSQGQIESINKAACALFGYTPEEILGRNVSMLAPESHRSQHDGYLKRYLSTGQAHVMGKLTEIEGVRKDGTLFPMSLQLSEIVTPEYTTFIGIARDITQHRQDIEEIRRLAFYDSLTGLPNRRLLMDRLRQAMHTSNRSGHHGALMFLDLDHFKQLNDTQGHDIGDLLLQQVASRIQGCARVDDSLARLGGDEFVVLLENLSANGSEAASQAEIVANKVLHSFQSAFNLNGQDHESTSSIGIVVFKGELDAMDELLKKADLAMYQAKAAGRNNARFYDPAMQAAVAARDALEKDMRDALATQAFALHYQIQVNHTGATTGAEALVRWNHPSKGMVSPAHFIPLAEETGLIQPLGQWVLETACAQLVAWANAEDSAHWTVSVNVSALQFALPDYVQTVTTALQKTGANPRLLKLELTESVLASDVDDVVAKMRDLKSQGVSLSLDDFGTGYSSLAYLKRLPLDQIKIDQSFVRNVLTDASDAAIARTILALGRSLGLQVIAEGVETLAQRNFLAGIGCQAYQGYYFGRPVAADALHQVISKKGL